MSKIICLSNSLVLVIQNIDRVPQKPEAFKSNNPGYIRGKSIKNGSTPERVEVVNLKIRLLKEQDLNYIDDYLFT